MKNERKIRRMLGEKYHLCSDNKGWWVLYRYYRDTDIYFSLDNKSIMSSDTHTEEDLIKFLKTHAEWDLHTAMMKYDFVLSLLVFPLALVNIFLGNMFLRGALLALVLMLVGITIVNNIVMMHNNKVQMIEFREHMDKIEARKSEIKDEDSK